MTRVSKKKRVVRPLIIILLLMAMLVFLLRDYCWTLIKDASYQIQFHSYISYCKSVDNEFVEFEYFRLPQKNIKQFVFSVRENTSYEDVLPVLRSMKDYCVNHVDANEIWQIVLSRDVQKEYPVGEPLIILTNQSASSQSDKEHSICLHLCYLDSGSTWKLQHLEESHFDYVEELVLCGYFESIEMLNQWTGLKLCIFKGRSYPTYYVFDQPLTSEEEWNSMKAEYSGNCIIADYGKYAVKVPTLGTEYS